MGLKQNFVIFLLVLFMFSCTNTSDKNSNIESIKGISLQSSSFQNELIIRPPQALDLWNDDLLVFSAGTDGFITICNKENLSCKSKMGKIGGGPNEFISPQYAGIVQNKYINIYDFNLRQLSKVEITQDNRCVEFSRVKLKDDDLFVTNLHVLNDNYILGSVLMGMNEPIVLMDADLNVIDSFGGVTEGLGIDSINDIKSYIGRFSSCKDYFVHAMNDLGYLACYKLSDGKVVKQWEFYAEQPIFNDGMLNKRRLKDGFWDVSIKNNQVYVIYNGKTYDERKDKSKRFPTTILVFDLYDGNLCKKYITDKDICRFVLDEDGVIYGVGTNPEVEIVKYILP